MKAIRLKTEYLTEPVGIDRQQPRLMWNCDAERSGAGPAKGESGVKQAGLNAHLSKPVEPEALFETLEKLIRDSRAGPD